MNKIFFLIYFFFIFNSFNLVHGNNNIVILDLNFLVNNSNKGKFIQNELNLINKKNLNILKTKEDTIKKKEIEIKNQQNLLSETELNDKIKIFRESVNDFNNLKNDLNSNFIQTKNELLKDFFDQITPLIQNYMETKSISIIIDKKNIFIAQSNYDITKEILEIINKNIK